MLTQRSRYALRAMLFLAEMPPAGPPTSMTRIATEANVPRKFLELILADLKGAQLLDSQRGKMGGYRLARAAHLISLGDIIRTIEGPLALVPCVSRTAYRPCNDCKSEADCAIRHAMMRVRDETARILDGTSLADATAKKLAAA
ncbi:rrf2 family protein [Sphingomonas sp. S17]|jgi:Rrf2 family protein|uniref:Rrf2 family transcriptional regulator n=2 Tax=Sphingomonas paucimobilis TaxID=13689 RepID=A0A411LLU2_SPHPI|nr:MULTISPECIES: Rrf2 family transcriptional regulator [Sphingomonas]EGI53385.1 rrf2 family protein [Sphingomonas sp. S17]MBQ1481551.1 Rrf2 family transcriptional regulator [Sphingomonas sp.]MCM3680040.1 Rrf2 family transcriptional regulator [Sphingomonas paucimobilis]MDG5970564.1 Rrf2 family transcriptional regulator [Sphingomonas paucimobilis]NNG58752.1 Rrf2 family transcriptional regulator [Sphingomonas paucimobilis]